MPAAGKCFQVDMEHIGSEGMSADSDHASEYAVETVEQFLFKQGNAAGLKLNLRIEYEHKFRMEF